MTMGGLMSDEVELLKRVYDRFNDRNVEGSNLFARPLQTFPSQSLEEDDAGDRDH